MKTVFDVCYNEKTKQYLDIYLPEREDFAVFLYFHGGGLESGDKSGEKILFNYLVSQGIAVVSANYRMYPKTNYPDFLIDAADATAWVFENIGNYGKIKGIYVGGSSAGGYISQMLCFDKTWLSKHRIKATDISCFIHDAGQPTGHFEVIKEKGHDPRDVVIDETAPMYFLGKNGTDISPMFFIVSDNDMKCRYEQTMLMIATLKHFGYDEEKISLSVQHGTHCHYIHELDENGVSKFGKIVYDFINK